MTKLVRWKVLFAAIAVGGAQPALAQDSDAQATRALQKVNDLSRAATERAHEAQVAEQAGDNESACRGFRNAEGLYRNAISALWSYPMTSDENRDFIKQTASDLQKRADAARLLAQDTCGQPNVVRSSASSSPSNDGGTDRSSGTTMEDLQQAQLRAKRQYLEADRLYEAHDYAGSCASARQSAESFAWIIAAIKANRSLGGAFANVDQVYANAQVASESRDETYCARSS